ncbi:triphosphoribosyl-dephospho-CoA synthase [Geoalkalibacter halelectricus]|uniref:triphosphoribosyl-dephospho-CoA synthase n=1 Tax=Geoalkalibacter halelectricus TaxID=2847045 RepID=UPI003D1E8CB6
MHSSLASEILRLADCLAEGLRRELFLTPKPGLVDLLDAGAHPDLSLPLMLESAEFVGRGYRSFARALAEGRDAAQLLPLGRDLEKQLLEKFGTNTHKGAIFLGGLLLCALAESRRQELDLQQGVVAVARHILPTHQTGATHGARLRDKQLATGILGEARRGLPSLFNAALPALAAAHSRGLDENRAGLATLARLMQCVDDTTALHRCGPPGLARLRRDGARLESLLGQEVDPWPFLLAANQDYIALGLTMGGVADLLAMAYGISTFVQQFPSHAAAPALTSG